MMNGKVTVVLAFVIGLAFGLSFSLSVQIKDPMWEKRYEICAELLVDERLIPTATPQICPALPPPCPTLTYKALPDVRFAKENLQGGIAEIQFGRDNLQKMLDATEGEYNWNVVAAVAVIDSGLSMLDETYVEVEFWQRLEKMTCPTDIPQYPDPTTREICETWRFSEKRILIEDNHDMALVVLENLYGMNATAQCMEFDPTFETDLIRFLNNGIEATEMLASWLCENCDG